jgi:hypothetical protein
MSCELSPSISGACERIQRAYSYWPVVFVATNNDNKKILYMAFKHIYRDTKTNKVMINGKDLLIESEDVIPNEKIKSIDIIYHFGLNDNKYSDLQFYKDVEHIIFEFKKCNQGGEVRIGHGGHSVYLI